MKTIRIFIFYFLMLLFIACGNNSTKNNKNIHNTIEIDKNQIGATETDINDEDTKIIFSTADLSFSNVLTPEEAMRVTSLREYHDNGAEFHFIILPSHNNKEVVIELLEGGDYPMYYLCVINSGIVDVMKGLNITPFWNQPGNDENNYSKKTFKIYEGYTIEINTEEKKENSKVQKYTKYYKIDDNGDFYEIKENER